MGVCRQKLGPERRIAKDDQGRTAEFDSCFLGQGRLIDDIEQPDPFGCEIARDPIDRFVDVVVAAGGHHA